MYMQGTVESFDYRSEGGFASLENGDRTFFFLHGYRSFTIGEFEPTFFDISKTAPRLPRKGDILYFAYPRLEKGKMPCWGYCEQWEEVFRRRRGYRLRLGIDSCVGSRDLETIWQGWQKQFVLFLLNHQDLITGYESCLTYYLWEKRDPGCDWEAFDLDLLLEAS